jgi:hypothetical protein
MKKHTKIKNRDSMENFDRVYREWPELPHIATIVAVPLKTVFINSAAAYWANVDKVIFDVDELQAYFPEYFNW